MKNNGGQNTHLFPDGELSDSDGLRECEYQQWLNGWLGVLVHFVISFP